MSRSTRRLRRQAARSRRAINHAISMAVSTSMRDELIQLAQRAGELEDRG